MSGSWKGSRVLLHFGAVDWEAKVWVTGKPAGSHRGGYDSFTFDVTDLRASGGGSQRLEGSAWDPSDEGPQPRGKQVSKPEENRAGGKRRRRPKARGVETIAAKLAQSGFDTRAVVNTHLLTTRFGLDYGIAKLK